LPTFGKIDAGFDQCGGFHDLGAPVTSTVTEQALELTQGLAPLTIGVGMDQIVEAFGFSEIEFAVLERTACEFTGLGCAQVLQG
jgi:hypothetical protein